MRTFISTAIVISALVAGGSAFANGSNDGSVNTTIAQSQLAFAAQSSARVATDSRDVTGSVSRAAIQRGAASQNFYPIDTSNLYSGGNR